MLINRYIFRQTASAVLMILISLTLIVWLTSILKEIKLLTSEGQTFILFLKITALALPNLIVTVAPVAFLIASLHSLNRLNGDSELIVLSAAGASVWRLFVPYFALAVVVSVSVLAANIFVIPKAARLLNEYVSKVRADLLSQVMQPGEFTDLEPGLTFHMRDKGKDGELLGVVVRDERDPKMATTVVADSGRSPGRGPALLDGVIRWSNPAAGGWKAGCANHCLQDLCIRHRRYVSETRAGRLKSAGARYRRPPLSR